MRKGLAFVFVGVFGLFVALWANAQVVGTLPYQLQNNTIADATQVMANFNAISANVNANAALAGANTNITSLRALANGSNLAPSVAFAGALSQGLYYDGTYGTCLTGNSSSAICITSAGVVTQVTSGVASSGVTVPQHAVMGFNLSTCPTGWVPANGTASGGITPIDARGVALRGQDNGAGRNPDGTTAVGTYQQDTLQDHSHQYAVPTGAVPVQSGTGSNLKNTNTMQTTTGAGTTGARVSTETRMQNVTVLFCEKT